MTPQQHVRRSIASVAAFATLGLLVESAHGLRLAGFVDDPIRREFVRLGHAHGAILCGLSVVLAWALDRLETPEAWATRIRWASWLGALLVGVGFVGGGLWHTTTDPGPLVLLVPAGALMVITAWLSAALVR